MSDIDDLLLREYDEYNPLTLVCKKCRKRYLSSVGHKCKRKKYYFIVT